MVPSDEQINSIPVSGSNQILTPTTVIGAADGKDSNANSDVTNNDSVQLSKEELYEEEILIKLENHLKGLKIKAITEHKLRMNIVDTLIRSSGMDNQQQEKFKKEIDKLFHPAFNS